MMSVYLFVCVCCCQNIILPAFPDCLSIEVFPPLVFSRYTIQRFLLCCLHITQQLLPSVLWRCGTLLQYSSGFPLEYEILLNPC